MTDQTSYTPKQGPALSESVSEVQGVFPSDVALQAAIAELTLAGFDRAAFSLPTGVRHGPAATPTESAADPNTDVDLRQARTMGTSMAGTIGALAAAGATVATGGAAAVVIVAAATVGIGSALATNAVQTTVNNAQHDERQEAAQAGRLVLAVTASDTDARTSVERTMWKAGATEVTSVERSSEVGLDAASWTG